VPKKRKIFTPEDIKDEVEDYVFNQDPPYDELDEIGGPHMTMTEISDIEITRQTKSGDNVIVDGTGTLELARDMGEGNSSDEAYPMTFSYEFDADGKIVNQLKRHVDTSSFFAGSEDIYGDFVGAIGPSQADVFRDSLQEIRNRLLPAPDAFLRKLLLVHVITALESYLSDFLISKILKDKATLRRFIEEVPVFKEQKMSVSEVFKMRAAIKKRAISQLETVVWHRLDHVGKMYSKVLGIDFPTDLGNINDAVKLRNLLVHRDGKPIDSKKQKTVSEKDIVKAMDAVEQLIDHIEDRWQKLRSKAEPKIPFDIEI
jgi:hypothetical protein